MIVAALISAGSAVLVGVLTLVGVIISNNAHDMVTDEKITELTREVREHNNFAKKIPTLEANIDALSKRIDDIVKRIDH